jgi:hypothetical protein
MTSQSEEKIRIIGCCLHVARDAWVDPVALANDLTLTPWTPMGAVPEPVTLYAHLPGGTIAVPRHYGIQRVGFPPELSWAPLPQATAAFTEAAHPQGGPLPGDG